MDDQNKPAEPAFRTAAEVFSVGGDRGIPTPGLSQSPGLRAVADSPVPGAERSHVIGPQQSAVDPVLAGLDTGYNPMTRAEDRVITRAADGAMVVPPADADSDLMPGPASTSAPAAPTAAAEAATVTPTAQPTTGEAPAAAPTAAPVAE